MICVIHFGIWATNKTRYPMFIDFSWGFQLYNVSGTLSRHLRVAWVSASNSAKYSLPKIDFSIVFMFDLFKLTDQRLLGYVIFFDTTRCIEYQIFHVHRS